MIKGVVNQLDSFNDLCFVDNKKKLGDIEIYNPKFSLLNGKEKMLKMLFHLEYMTSRERSVNLDRESDLINRLSFKRNILNAKSKEEYKEFILEWLLIKRGGLENSIFASTSVACNIKAATFVENFVMNMLVERFDRLYYTKYVIGDIEEEKAVEKKKNKKKKRKKNKKKTKKEEKEPEPEPVEETEKTDKTDFKVNFKGEALLFNSDISSKEHKNTLSDSLEAKKPKQQFNSEEEVTEPGEQNLCFNNLSFDNQVLMDKCSFDSLEKEVKKEEPELEAKVINETKEKDNEFSDDDDDLMDFQNFITNSKVSKTVKKEPKKVEHLIMNELLQDKLEKELYADFEEKQTVVPEFVRKEEKQTEFVQKRVSEEEKSVAKQKKEKKPKKKPKLKKIVKGKKISSTTNHPKLKKEISLKKPKKEQKRESNDKKQKKGGKKEVNNTIKTLKCWKDESCSLSIIPIRENETKTIRIDTNERQGFGYETEPEKKDSRIKFKKKGNNNRLKRKHAQTTDSPSNTPKLESEKSKYEEEEPKTNKKLNDSRKESEVDISVRSKKILHGVFNEQIEQITDDLLNFSNELEEARGIILDRINSLIRKTFAGEDIYVKEYGSYATKLLTPYSDMDLSIQGCLMLDREQKIKMLDTLTNNLRLFPFISKANSILTAAVPVIKLEADPSIEYENSDIYSKSIKIKVDIIVDDLDHYNPVSTSLRTTNYIKYCITNYPSFFKNMLLLKFSMNCNGLSNSYKGGLPSYALCVMYVAYIEHLNLEKETNHFELLVGFLEFISTKFDYENDAIFFGTGFR